MENKLNSILLIDDDKATNFIHETIIKKADITNEIITHSSAINALKYLKSDINGEYTKPDLIFLDINMPAMNGWEFLEEYKKLDADMKGKIVVVMLTTSLNPNDEEKAKSIEDIKDFKHKLLTKNTLSELVDNYFS